MLGESSVSVVLRGGLGNQLFGWAAGLSLAERLGTRLVLLGRAIRRKDHHILDPRTFELGYFGLAEASGVENFVVSRFSQKPVFRERGFEYDPRFQEISEPVTLDGYFQSWRYFQAVQHLVKSSLLSRMSLTQQAREAWNDESENDWIGVHVRRGDYEKVGVMALPGPDYYSKAIARAKELTGAGKVCVFSDDILAARHAVPSADLYFGPGEISRAGDVLNLLSRSSALVGANSSLSWWAAFLGGGRQTVKLFPSNWFSDASVDCSDLLPPNWETIVDRP